MKTIYIPFLIIVFIVGCSKKEAAPSSQQESFISPSQSDCTIIAVFSDTVTQTQADIFLQSHNVNIYSLFGFDQIVAHSAMIQVTSLQTRSLVDTLKKYSVIKSAKLYCFYL